MIFLRNNYLLLGITAMLSILLSFWAVFVDPIINPDALLYLSAAEEFSHGNFRNAFELYKWPFYSFTISITQSIFGISSQNAAYTINAVMHAFAMLGFLACVHVLGGSKRTLLIAAILILCFPSFNKYRSFIIRDAGFLAFYLWSLYHLFFAVKTERILRYALAFFLMGVAMLFRIEAIALLTIVPAYLLYARTRSKNMRCFWLAITLVGSATLFFGITLWLFGEHAQATQPGLLGLIQGSMEQLSSSLDHKLKVIRLQLLNEFSWKVAPAVLIITVLTIVIYEPLRRLAYIFAFFSWHALKNRLVLQDQPTRHLFYVLCLIQLILLSLFTLINMFLVSRHTMALTLTILILAPFSIEYFYLKWRNHKQSSTHSHRNTGSRIRWWFPTLLFLFALLSIDGLDLKTNKLEIKEAGKWLATKTDQSSSIYSNDALILHYSGRTPAHLNLRYNWRELDHMLASKRIFDFNFAAITVTKNTDKTREFLSKSLNTKPAFEKQFDNNRTLFIFDLRDGQSSKRLDRRYFKISSQTH